MGQLKEGNERPVHITLSHDDVWVLKNAVSRAANWQMAGDVCVLERVYMVLDAAIGAAGYYPESQPHVYRMDTATQAHLTEQRLERLKKDLKDMGYVRSDGGFWYPKERR